MRKKIQIQELKASLQQMEIDLAAEIKDKQEAISRADKYERLYKNEVRINEGLKEQLHGLGK